jgi:hypothetical protein
MELSFLPLLKMNVSAIGPTFSIILVATTMGLVSLLHAQENGGVMY